ncbi:MAG: hypothetical protein ACRED5_21530 [Propylenella sp.]
MEIGGEMTLAAVVQALASIAAFVFIIFQVTQINRSIKGATQDRVYAHYTEICKIFLQKPYLRPYFYENKELLEDDPRYPHLRSEIDFMSETILGLIEHAVLQQGNLPPDCWENCWLPYANERLRMSAEIKKFFAPNTDWYTDALRDVVNESEGRLEVARTRA